jgi:hypothetical protein
MVTATNQFLTSERWVFIFSESGITASEIFSQAVAPPTHASTNIFHLMGNVTNERNI